MQNVEINAGIIIAIISLVGTIVTTIIQFLKDKEAIKKDREALREEIKRDEITAVGSLADMALKLNKQEIETLRLIVEDLKARTKYLEQELTDCQAELSKERELTDSQQNNLRSSAKEIRLLTDKIEELMKVINCTPKDIK